MKTIRSEIRKEDCVNDTYSYISLARLWRRSPPNPNLSIMISMTPHRISEIRNSTREIIFKLLE